jgi:DNA-binding MurR/RpiR family transcriptional regulator
MHMAAANARNVLEVIRESLDRLSPQQSKIAHFLLNNHHKVAFLTGTHLARKIGVSQPTMIRFAQTLGFPKYHLFAEAFQDLLKAELTSADRYNISLSSAPAADPDSTGIIARDIRTLTALARNFPRKNFDDSVELVCRSRNVVSVGTRGSAFLALYLGYFLGKVKRNVSAVTSGSTTDYDRLLNLTGDDLVVAIAFPRYPIETLNLAAFCRERGVKVIAITDRMDSPLAPLAALSMVVPITFTTIFDSYCSVLCLLNMLVTGVGRGNQPEAEVLFKEFENLAQMLKVFFQKDKPDAPEGLR